MALPPWDSLAEAAARRRALMIARTGSAGVLGLGNLPSWIHSPGDELIQGCQWPTVGDDRVRVSHQFLQGVLVGPRELFDVGGTPAPYPGWWGLPPDQRASCRCTIVSTF